MEETTSSSDETSRRGATLAPAHRERLLAAGAEQALLDSLDLRLIEGPFPPWWERRSNALYVTADVPISPARINDLLERRLEQSLVVLAADVANAACLRLWGSEATVFIGPGARLANAEINCGGASSIVLGRDVSTTYHPSLDARNGGSIIVHDDQLWATDVMITTDDMHRLEDVATGRRINGFGGHIVLGPHVWLGRDAVVTGTVTIGRNCVVGMRSLVRNGEFEDGTALAGTPARVIRTGVTWTYADTP